MLLFLGRQNKILYAISTYQSSREVAVNLIKTYLDLPGKYLYNISFFIIGLGIILIGLFFKRFNYAINAETWRIIMVLIATSGFLVILPISRSTGLALTMINYTILATKLSNRHKEVNT